MNTFYIQLIPVALLLLPLTVPIGIVFWIRHQRKGRRNPLTYQMLRAPGESISQRIELLSDDIDLYLTMTGVVPLICYSMYLSTRYIANNQVSPVIFVVMSIGFLTYFGVRLNKTYVQRHKEQLGLDCERSVGQELNQLMLEGCRVFHDFQADNFNIDHVVIAGNGIFAIETKGRSKPDRGRGQEDVLVTYDGQTLQFPTWREREPIEQAKRQAVWLSGWLTKAVGEQVFVRPVLALPGWFVDRKSKDFLIYNGKNPQYLMKIAGEKPLSPEMIQRVAHQIDQQCRDIAPQAYKKAE
jgi:hypothetical protein